MSTMSTTSILGADKSFVVVAVSCGGDGGGGPLSCLFDAPLCCCLAWREMKPGCFSWERSALLPFWLYCCYTLYLRLFSSRRVVLPVLTVCCSDRSPFVVFRCLILHSICAFKFKIFLRVAIGCFTVRPRTQSWLQLKRPFSRPFSKPSSKPNSKPSWERPRTRATTAFHTHSLKSFPAVWNEKAFTRRLQTIIQ